MLRRLLWGWLECACLVYDGVFAFLVALIVIDFQRMILPNALVFSVGLLGLVYGAYTDLHLGLTWLGGQSLLAALLYGAFAALMGWVVTLVLKKEALGGGDVKFFAAAGAWLGLASFPAFCILSGVIGILVGLIWGRVTGAKIFPFGPALILALYCLWLFDGSFLVNYHVR